MIIKAEGIPLIVEHDFDDGEIYLSSVTVDAYNIIEIIKDSILDEILEKVITRLEEDDKDNEYDGAIDDYQDRWVEL